MTEIDEKEDTELMPEYLEFRCCMCPNDEGETICPGREESLKKEPTVCRFVKTYVDDRGWKYRVMSGLGEGAYKARFQKPDKHGEDGWHCVHALPWCGSFDEAQADLNALAKRKSWKEVTL